MSERKAIFITGGASGIGLAVGKYFSERGWFVGLTDINTAGLAEAAKQLSGECFTYKHDVRDREAWDEALKAFHEAAGGRIDVMFNNAGIPVGGLLHENSPEEIDRCLDINLKGVLYGAQAAYPYLKETAPGSCLLNTASAAGIYGASGVSVYCATKFGVRAVTESLDAEWHEDGIKVASLMPSFIDTPLLDLAPNHTTNEPVRANVQQAGLEITPVIEVAEAAWAAVHGDKLHSVVGKTARRINWVARYLPTVMRKQAKQSLRPLG